MFEAAKLPQIKLMAAATFIIAASAYAQDRNGGDACGNILVLPLLLLSAAEEEEASDIMIEYSLLIGHLVLALVAEETMIDFLAFQGGEDENAGLIIFDDDRKNASASSRFTHHIRSSAAQSRRIGCCGCGDRIPLLVLIGSGETPPLSHVVPTTSTTTVCSPWKLERESYGEDSD